MKLKQKMKILEFGVRYFNNFFKKYFVVSKKYSTFASSDISLVFGDVILLSVKFLDCFETM